MGHSIIIKEQITASVSVLVYIPIIDYRAHIGLIIIIHFILILVWSQFYSKCWTFLDIRNAYTCDAKITCICRKVVDPNKFQTLPVVIYSIKLT